MPSMESNGIKEIVGGMPGVMTWAAGFACRWRRDELALKE